ncbi:RbsD/FucU domain-containing protein [Variovorax sp. YR752]|uniref:RbsD/FucU family protein n=1 Tax=Variovorax sp. YR752 TaxID=1884383 RepID=UPI003137E94F
MLKGINPLLSPQLLKILAEMGHGDEIVLADANFTAESLGRGKPVLQMPGIGMGELCAAVLSVFPLDQYEERPCAYMHVGGTAPDYRSALQREVVERAVASGDAQAAQFEAMERFAFYDRARKAFAIVQTGELQAYANFLFKKGVIAEPLRP